MNRIYSILLVSMFSAFNLLASPSDHGRVLDESNSSGYGPIGTVIAFIIGVLLVGFLLWSVFSDEKQNSEDKGCITIFFVIVLGIAFLGMLAKCS